MIYKLSTFFKIGLYKKHFQDICRFYSLYSNTQRKSNKFCFFFSDFVIAHSSFSFTVELSISLIAFVTTIRASNKSYIFYSPFVPLEHRFFYVSLS